MPGISAPRLYLQEPEWTWILAIEMFIGGLAAGSYFAYALLDLLGNAQDRGVARRWLGFLPLPLMLLVAIILIVDLGQPLRFLNLIFTHGSAAERGGFFMLNPNSPMNWGSYAITAFGLFTLVAFVDSLAHRGRLKVNLEVLAHNAVWLVLGVLFAFGTGAYSGVLVNVTQQTVWTDTVLLGALYLVTAAFSGIGAAGIAAYLGKAESTARAVRDALVWFGVVTVVAIATFAVYLGPFFAPFALGSVTAPLFWGGVVALGLVVPAAVLLFVRTTFTQRVAIASAFVLVGAFAFRLTVLYSSIAALHG